MSLDGWAALPRGATGLSAVCSCGISWSYSLTIIANHGFGRILFPYSNMGWSKIGDCCIFWSWFSGGSRGVQRDRLKTPSLPPVFNILWKWNNKVSIRPNYFILVGYLRKKKGIISEKGTPPFNTYKHPFQIFWIRPVCLCEYVAPQNDIICYCCTFWLWIFENMWFLTMPWFLRIFDSSWCHGFICSFGISGYEFLEIFCSSWCQRFDCNYGISWSGFMRIFSSSLCKEFAWNNGLSWLWIFANLRFRLVPWICLQLWHFQVRVFENLLIFIVQRICL